LDPFFRLKYDEAQ